MIVKKIPILQGFPAFNTVKKLSKKWLETDVSRPVFYDIETTGLSRYSTFLYLIGAAAYENDQWVLSQWMAENPEEEALILCEFFDFLKDCSCTIQYNGNRFDQPYLEERYRRNGLQSPFEKLPALDLYQRLKICRPLFGLSHMKQPDLEAFLGLKTRRYCDGGECIRLYRAYVKEKNVSLAETVLGHNREDLLGLGPIWSMLGYTALYSGDYTPQKALIRKERLFLSADLPSTLPAEISVENGQFSLKAADRTMTLSVPLKSGRLRRYYKNYKDYDYLPEEDTAISKHLSRYVDKSLRVPASPSTCYTWFICNEDFLENRNKQLQYLQSSLPCFLEQLAAES